MCDPGDRRGASPRRGGPGRLWAVGLAVVIGIAGCGEGGGSDGASEASIRPRNDLDPPVAAQLDSGTAAYRADDYEEARRHYRHAAELAPGLASAWFGVMLAERALGNDSVADSIAARLEGVIQMDPHGEGTHAPGPDTAAPEESGFHGSGTDSPPE